MIRCDGFSHDGRRRRSGLSGFERCVSFPARFWRAGNGTVVDKTANFGHPYADAGHIPCTADIAKTQRSANGPVAPSG